jgi:HAE1 family hydrophobic/amphiphilic exporter-1
VPARTCSRKSTLVQLETAINGVQGMRYIASDATSAGEATIRVIFEPGTDPNEAVVRVKTRVDQVMPNLPLLVQREGVIITPVQPSMLMYVNLYGDGKDADELFLYNYAFTQLIPEIQRIPGVAQAQILGSRKYAMRVWLKPDRMRAYNISAEEVMEAMAGAEPYCATRTLGPELRHGRAGVRVCACIPRPVQRAGAVPQHHRPRE